MSDDEKLDRFIQLELEQLAWAVYDRDPSPWFKKGDKRDTMILINRATEFIRSFNRVRKLIPVEHYMVDDEVKKLIDEVDSKKQTFTINSGKVRITDPCYDMDTWCAGDIENVRNGKWLAFIHTSDENVWGIRVADLQVVEENFYNKAIEPNWIKTDIDVGVDSAQAGIFDYDFYANMEGHGKDLSEHGKFYDKICELTGSRRQFGVVDFGVASRTGFGDGGYTCYIAKEGDEVVAIKLIYIGDEDEYNEDEDECDID